MDFNKSVDGSGFPVVILDDGTLIRKFHVFSDNHIQEKVTLKRKRGRPVDLFYWYHKDLDAMKMSAVLERYEMDDHLGEGSGIKTIRRL